MFDINLEAMQALLKSRLGSALDALWQEVIDYRDSTLTDVTYRNKIIAIRKYFEKNTVPKFKEIVWKYVGLHIETVHPLDIFSTGSFCTMMYIDKKQGNYGGTIQIESVLNAEHLFKSSFLSKLMFKDKGPFTAEDLLKIANSYDKESGSIKTTVRNELQKWVNAEMGFDITTAFAIEDQLPKGSGISNLTASEITAIILHEIGHNLTLIEHAADCYARVSTFRYLEAAFSNANKDKPEEVLKLANSVADEVAKIDKVTAEKLREVAKKVGDDVETARKSDNSITYGRVVMVLTGLLEIVIGVKTSIYFAAWDLISGGQQSARFTTTYTEQHRKLSDIPVNERLATWQERKADEYAFTHGYGADIVSALDKLTKMMERRGLSEKAIANLNDIENQGKIFRLFKAIRLVAMLPLICGNYQYALYPAGSKRYVEMLRVTIQRLKQYSTNSEYIAKYISDCDRIIDIISKPGSDDEMTAKLYRVYDLFLKYCSIPSFLDWILHGRVRREIEDLVNDVEATGNSLLTYYGHKIQQIKN